MRAVLLGFSLCALLLFPGVSRADQAGDVPEEKPDAAVLVGRLRLDSSREYQTSRRGTELAITPGLGYALSDRLTLSAGPVFYSGLRPIAPALPGYLVSTEPASPVTFQRKDYGANLGYEAQWRRLHLELTGGVLSLGRQQGGQTPALLSASLSGEYHLRGKLALYGELSNNPPPGGLGSHGTVRGHKLLLGQTGAAAATLGARYSVRDNESLSLGVSYESLHALWLRGEVGLRF